MHLTHGSPVSFSGKLYNIVHYGVNEEGYIDYDEVERIAEKMYVSHRPIYVKKEFKKYFGMASKHAMNLYHTNGTYKTDEGRMKLIPYVGPLDNVLQQIEGGLKSMMCFIGAKSMKEVPKKTTFYKIHHGLNDKFLKCEDFKE